MKNESIERARFLGALDALKDRAPGFHSAPWLLSSYSDPIWNLRFGKAGGELNFKVRLDDGSYLTDSSHSKTLESFKSFLLVQTHLELSGGIVYAPQTAAARVLYATHICDYLLINAGALNLARNGLHAFGESDGYRMLKRLAMMPASDAVYQWRDRLTGYLRTEGGRLSDSEIRKYTNRLPELARTEGSELGFSDDELVRARTWLWANGYYVTKDYEEGSRLTVKSSLLLPLLYPHGTLRRTWKRTVFPELCVFQRSNYARERSPAPVRGEIRSETALHVYLKVIKKWKALDKVALAVPQGLLHAAGNTSFLREVSGAPPGRYATLPHDVVLKSFRDALEFWMAHGKALLDCYIRLLVNAQKNSLSIAAALSNDPESVLPISLQGLGINCWSIRDKVQASRALADMSSAEEQAMAREYFEKFRASHGLYELLQVLGGALLIVLGTLMARRQGELVDLVCGNLLDATRSRLMFDARKRGSYDVRERLARPAPSIVVEILTFMESFQESLVSLGMLEQQVQLLCFPNRWRGGLGAATDESLNTMLDMFCDYFSVAADAEGRRYYIRQHQLRRFFAILFFWGNSFAGLESLRWFLGHTDVEHLYNYITNSIPGAVLRGVKVDYAVEQIQANFVLPEHLLDHIQLRFGSRNVKVLDQEELGEFIDELLMCGTVTIEPEFFSGPAGKEYRILIVVSPKERA